MILTSGDIPSRLAGLWLGIPSHGMTLSQTHCVASPLLEGRQVRQVRRHKPRAATWYVVSIELKITKQKPWVLEISRKFTCLLNVSVFYSISIIYFINLYLWVTCNNPKIHLVTCGICNLDKVWLQLENMIVQVSYQLLMKEKKHIPTG